MKNSNSSYVESFVQKKLFTTHIEREHHQNEFNCNVLEKTKIDYLNTSNGTLFVGPFFSGKTYLMLKLLTRMTG